MQRKKKVIKALNDLINNIDEKDVRSANISTKLEVIKVPSDGEWQENRPGPRYRVTINLEWGHIQPANPGAGEESNWQDW